jgi:hypothetical protein
VNADKQLSGASTPGPDAARPADVSGRCWQPSPWVVERRGRISFQVQPCPTLDEPAPIERALATVEVAEELGFDAVAFGDHPIMLDCWVWLAAAATRTRRIRVGTGVACAAYRVPRVTARLATDLDHLSGGRLVLGLGSGWVHAEFEMLGVPFTPRSERAARLEETLSVVTELWGPAATSVLGERYTPRQLPRPPIMVAGGGLETMGWWPSTPMLATSAPRLRPEGLARLSRYPPNWRYCSETARGSVGRMNMCCGPISSVRWCWLETTRACEPGVNTTPAIRSSGRSTCGRRPRP